MVKFMNKIVLIDGNNLLYRSYYATAYSGSLMRNSKDFPTNALYGLINMLNKIINEEAPTHIMIAFDKGKTFRHDKYETYKAGRSETPDDLKKQFPVALELSSALGIKHYEIDNYEADDIIGTFASYVDTLPDTKGLIVSSDKDLLQLISDKVTVKLLKSNDYIMMDKEKFKEVYGIAEPIKMIDLKSLMGDASDNIPGVKGIGEKTAISLIQKYDSLAGVYENIKLLAPKVQEKLTMDKENAYMSYALATIYREVPIKLDLQDIEYKGINIDAYQKLLTDLEFYSLLKKMDTKTSPKKELEFKIVTKLSEIKLETPYAIYLETLGYNYHNDKPLGVSIHDMDNSYYIPFDLLKNSSIFNDNKEKYTYDLKKLVYVFKKYNVGIDKKIDDLMLISYLLNKHIKTDIAYLANSYNYDITFYDKLYGTEITYKYPKNDDYIKEIVKKANFIYLEHEGLEQELESEDMTTLYHDLELPLSYVLAKMEANGFLVNIDYLKEMEMSLDENLHKLEELIFTISGQEFNLL